MDAPINIQQSTINVIVAVLTLGYLVTQCNGVTLNDGEKTELLYTTTL